MHIIVGMIGLGLVITTLVPDPEEAGLSFQYFNVTLAIIGTLCIVWGLHG